VLTIAGSDPSGGAGLQADLAVFTTLSCHGMAVVDALTVQNSAGVTAAHPVPAQLVARQLDALLSDCPPAAAKTGMLPSEEIVRAVAAAFVERQEIPLVVDPVALSGDGARLIETEAERAIAAALVPVATVVAPNALEASSMTGLLVADAEGAAAAARRLVEMGARAALVKRPRIATTRRVHGTGCALSAAIAAFLARGVALERAVRLAGDYVHAAIAAARVDGAGAATLDFVAGAAEISG
jgi:hydroxymethylpyrimidine kinase/phosphomethylpyrimidine kinase